MTPRQHVVRLARTPGYKTVRAECSCTWLGRRGTTTAARSSGQAHIDAHNGSWRQVAK